MLDKTIPPIGAGDCADDGSRELDAPAVRQSWAENASLDALLRCLQDTVVLADHEVMTYGSYTKDDLENSEIEIRDSILRLMEEIENCLPNLSTRNLYTLRQKEENFVTPVRREMQAALDAAAVGKVINIDLTLARNGSGIYRLLEHPPSWDKRYKCWVMKRGDVILFSEFNDSSTRVFSGLKPGECCRVRLQRRE